MNLNSLSAISNTTADGQVCQVNMTSSDSASVGRTERGAPPPPPPDGGGLIDAIAKALQSLGVGESSSESANSDSTNAAISNDAADTNSANAAQALGSFLQELLGALHQQKTTKQTSTETSSDTQALSNAIGAREFRGPARLQDDLQSLMTQLQSAENADAEETSTTTTSTSNLSSSFAKLLQALGVSESSSGAGNSNTKLSDFLQTLMSNLPTENQRGNVINVVA